MSNQVVKLKRDVLAPCMTCPLCHKLFRDAATIIECLHTFCRKCIYKKLSDEEMEFCPICNIHLGCVPLEKLRADHNLQDVRAKIFPYKRRKVEAPEVVTPVTLPAKRKERSLSSLVVSTPRVSTYSGMTGRRSKSVARKASKGSIFTIEKSPKKCEVPVEDHPESSSAPLILNKFSHGTKLNSTAAEPSVHPSPDKERENCSEPGEGKVDLWKPLTCLVEVANKSKSSKLTPQVTVAQSEALQLHDNEGLLCNPKNKEHAKILKGQDKKKGSNHPPQEPDEPKMLRKFRQRTHKFGDFRVPQAVLDATSAKWERRNDPIWFSLVASDDQRRDAVLPQISASYLRIKDGNIPVSFIQKYLKKKLNLTSEDEVIRFVTWNDFSTIFSHFFSTGVNIK
ncbi:E3 ubiquitin ligase DRIP2-like [Olea europaea subsp. europaea]|uniref:E3 ubiquitin ligase DRIP2-like n=2 Tax=Olea europaea subsp. europaea TaxID=158383 RepID=A0A8S0PV67_OLEEU|nr:E3 ubiquitin ligase DRIP2-like [Olea europaea subsp. europaea]